VQRLEDRTVERRVKAKTKEAEAEEVDDPRNTLKARRPGAESLRWSAEKQGELAPEEKDAQGRRRNVEKREGRQPRRRKKDHRNPATQWECLTRGTGSGGGNRMRLKMSGVIHSEYRFAI